MRPCSTRRVFLEGRVLLSSLSARIVAGGRADDKGPLVVYRVDASGSLDETDSTPAEAGSVCALAPFFNAANRPSSVVVEPINNAVALFSLSPITPDLLVHAVGGLVLACAISPDGQTMCVRQGAPLPHTRLA